MKNFSVKKKFLLTLKQMQKNLQTFTTTFRLKQLKNARSTKTITQKCLMNEMQNGVQYFQIY